MNLSKKPKSAMSCEFKKMSNSHPAVNSFKKSNSRPAVNSAVNCECKIMSNSQPAVN